MEINAAFIRTANKAYKGIAEVRIEDGRYLVIREIRPNEKGVRALRPFIDGRYRIRLTTAQIIKISNLLN